MVPEGDARILAILNKNLILAGQALGDIREQGIGESA